MNCAVVQVNIEVDGILEGDYFQIPQLSGQSGQFNIPSQLFHFCKIVDKYFLSLMTKKNFILFTYFRTCSILLYLSKGVESVLSLFFFIQYP